MDNWQSTTIAITSCGTLVFTIVKFWTDSTTMTPIRSTSAMARGSLWRRHWFSALVMLAGVLAMVSVLALGPPTALTVFIGCVGAALTALGMASVLVLQASLGLVDRLSGARRQG